jgi:putative DNA primase/helicase
MNEILSPSNTGLEAISSHMEELKASFEPLPHQRILNELLSKIGPLDFRQLAEIKKDTEKVRKNHYLILCVDEVIRLAKGNNWGICRNHEFIYLFNGAFWQLLDPEELKTFLGDAAKKMGIDRFEADYFKFRDELYKQFLTLAHLPKPRRLNRSVLINLKNGTFVINDTGYSLKDFDREDFMTYQLPFIYDPSAKPLKFIKYLNRVLPDLESQTVLAEYLGYVLLPQETLKLEKALLPYGTGANGKSVLFDVINALFGKDNVTSFSLKNLTNDNGYSRATIANKLLNYTSEIGGIHETSIFKQLVSGEPVEARLPYCNPFILEQYAKFIFNCNELPKDIEHSEAYFRRFLIIPFTVRIPEEEQDKELANRIIRDELSGVFNWILEGLRRLLLQRNFSRCDAAFNQLQAYRKESDSIQMFLDDENWEKSVEARVFLKEIYQDYARYARESGFKLCSAVTLSHRLKALGFECERKSKGTVFYLRKKVDY